jgi:HSP20 family protein
MSLVRWDPFRELDEFSERLGQMFRLPSVSRARQGTREGLMTMPDWAPAVDIVESPQEFLLKAELPDVKKEDIKVSVHGGQLRIEGEKKQEKEEKDRKYHRVERFHGSFLRSFTLPENVDGSKLSAEFKDGVLHVHLPKTEKATPRAVEVKVS